MCPFYRPPDEIKPMKEIIQEYELSMTGGEAEKKRTTAMTRRIYLGLDLPCVAHEFLWAFWWCSISFPSQDSKIQRIKLRAWGFSITMMMMLLGSVSKIR